MTLQRTLVAADNALYHHDSASRTTAHWRHTTVLYCAKGFQLEIGVRIEVSKADDGVVRDLNLALRCQTDVS